MSVLEETCFSFVSPITLEQYWWKHKLSKQVYRALFIAQEGKCAICKRLFSQDLKPHVDHDHLSDKVRGLLCFGCNTMLGGARDSSVILERGAEYIRHYHQDSLHRK